MLRFFSFWKLATGNAPMAKLAAAALNVIVANLAISRLPNLPSFEAIRPHSAKVPGKDGTRSPRFC
jgi:hypothetical protein